MKEYRNRPENKARQVIHMERWVAENPERLREIRVAYADRRAEKTAAWHLAHPAARADYERRRRARKRSNGPSERYTLAQVLDRDGWTCQLCLEPIDPQPADLRSKGSVDHIVPLALGGHDVLSNIRAAHVGCNSAAGARIAREAARHG